MGKRKRMLKNEDDDDDAEFDLPSKQLITSHVRANEKRLIIVLEGAQLETVKVSRSKFYKVFAY
jgi:hypothetical protein